MLTSLVRRLRARRRRRLDAARATARPRGSGWDRLAQDPTYDFTRSMAESLGGQPPRVRRRGQG